MPVIPRLTTMQRYERYTRFITAQTWKSGLWAEAPWEGEAFYPA